MPNYRILALLAVLCGVCGCPNVTLSKVQSVALSPGQTPALDQSLSFDVGGAGTCADLTIDWGDDSALQHFPSGVVAGDFQSLPFQAVHTFSGLARR